jgi:Fe2+ transport system protein B
VGNYAGVTVERKEGRLQGVAVNPPIQILDLPGTYSLSPQSLDEQISRDVLFQRLSEVPAPALVVVVVDASNLERNLYYATQVAELGYRTIIALNMIDVAEKNGAMIDAEALAAELGVEVVPMAASTGRGLEDLRRALVKGLESRHEAPRAGRFLFDAPSALIEETSRVAALLPERTLPGVKRAEALLLISDHKTLEHGGDRYPKTIADAVNESRNRLQSLGLDWRTVVIEARYTAAAQTLSQAVQHEGGGHETLSDRIDRVVTHKVWGMLVFLGIMALMFLSIFTFAKMPMDFLQNSVAWVGGKVDALMHHIQATNLIDRSSINPLESPFVKRLFDPAAESARYYAKTGIYPINHCMVVRRSIVEKHPWVILNLYNAFLQAKDKLVQELDVLLDPYYATGVVDGQAKRAIHTDVMAYGVNGARKVLETISRFLYEDGLTSRLVGLDEVFAKPTLDL